MISLAERKTTDPYSRKKTADPDSRKKTVDPVIAERKTAASDRTNGQLI